MKENRPKFCQYDDHIRQNYSNLFLMHIHQLFTDCRLAYVCGGNSMGEDGCKQVYLQNSIV